MKGNTFNPKFNKEMAFQLESKMFYSVMMFLVYDDEQLVYWNSIAVRNLKQGYSVVPLLDLTLNPVFNTQLFVKVTIK